MQAPSTPSGVPAQQPDERPCPGCGASNGPLAAFCWQCYRPFGAHPGADAMPASPVPGVYAPAPARRGLVTMVGVVLVTLAVVGGAVFLFTRGSGVELPESFGGLTRVTGSEAEAVSTEFRTAAEAEGLEGDIAIYGSGPVPSAALIWIGNAPVPSTEAAFEEFAAGFNEGIGTGGALVPGSQVGKVVDGVEYVCASVVSNVPGGLCMWQEDDVFYLLFDLSGRALKDSRALAVTAHVATA